MSTVDGGTRMRFSSHATSVAVAVAVVVLCVAVGRFTHVLLRARFARLAEESSFPLGNVLAWSLRHSLPFWFLLGGVYVASMILGLNQAVRRGLDQVLLGALIVSLTTWVANLGARLLRLRASFGAPPSSATGVVRNALKIVVFVIGGLVLLHVNGISFAPVLTTVGLGGLAVALGLRETVANLIAGMQLTLAGTVRVGDFIRIESGEEGTIQDIHWRETRVLTLADTIVVIPNSRLVETVVTNYDLPAKRFELAVPVTVHHASDLDLVERVTMAVARTVMRTIRGGVPDAEPTFALTELGETGVHFQVLLWIAQVPDRLLVRHAFIKLLVQAYDAHGIVVPAPIRAINLAQERAVRHPAPDGPGGEPRQGDG